MNLGLTVKFVFRYVKYASRGIKQNDVSRKPFIHRKDQDERDEAFL